MNAPASSPAGPPSRAGLFVLALVLAGFVAYVLTKSAQLPALVATHFDLHGKANGWMSREKHLWFTLGIGTLLPLLMIGIAAVVRRGDGRGLNIPNKTYWLAPERRAATFDYFSRQMLWLATLMAVFQAALFKSILDANSVHPPALPMPLIMWLTGGFLALIAIWVAGVLVRFLLPRA